MDEDKLKQAFFNCQLSAKNAEIWLQDVARVLSDLPPSESVHKSEGAARKVQPEGDRRPELGDGSASKGRRGRAGPRLESGKEDVLAGQPPRIRGC